MASVITDRSIDYTAKASNHSSPMYLKVSPINNVQSITTSITSTVGPYEFVIPSKCINLSKCKLAFDASVPAQGASNYAWVNANMLSMLDRVVLTTSNSNQTLCDIPNFNRYTQIVSPVFCSQTELQNKANPYFQNSLTAIPTLSTSAALGQQTPLENLSIANSGANPDGTAGSNDMGRPFGNALRKLFVTTATNTANNFSVEMDLSSIYATIFDVDKLLYFGGENLILSLYFAPNNRYSWYGTSATNPSTGAAVLASALTISNPYLYLYTEQNLDIIQGLTSKVMTSGLSMPFPFVFVQRNTATSGSWAITNNMSRGYGSRLLCALTSIFNPTETNNLSGDHSINELIRSGGTGGVYTSLAYNTLLDQIPILTQNNVAVMGAGIAAGEQFLVNKNKLTDSAVNSILNYNIDFVHIDSFVDQSVPLCKADFSVVDGLPLDSNHTYTFVSYGVSTSSVTHNVYTCFVAQKTLNISAQGIQVL
jgi:hypothetical protein